MAGEYSQQLRDYTGNRYLSWHKGGQLSKQAHTTLLRAATFAEELGVDYSTYVRAQFWVFDDWFRRPPKLHELASYNTRVPAKKRVEPGGSAVS